MAIQPLEELLELVHVDLSVAIEVAGFEDIVGIACELGDDAHSGRLEPGVGITQQLQDASPEGSRPTEIDLLPNFGVGLGPSTGRAARVTHVADDGTNRSTLSVGQSSKRGAAAATTTGCALPSPFLDIEPDRCCMMTIPIDVGLVLFPTIVMLLLLLLLFLFLVFFLGIVFGFESCFVGRGCFSRLAVADHILSIGLGVSAAAATTTALTLQGIQVLPREALVQRLVVRHNEDVAQIHHEENDRLPKLDLSLGNDADKDGQDDQADGVVGAIPKEGPPRQLEDLPGEEGAARNDE
mmetsp:Transcript_28177/g.81485  ORF Transcript_28177/g.81485 Transcript_28177/m.81485 type:complete len:296 (+) Transcript_28177:2431-3318(+)